jgi:hypothetical protein
MRLGWAGAAAGALYTARLCTGLQVLTLDFRSTRQRLDTGPAAQQRNAASLSSAAQQQQDTAQSPERPGSPVGIFHVVLEGIDVSYDVAQNGSIIVGGATLQSALALQHASLARRR